MGRYLPTSSLPVSLFASDTLRLPPGLTEAYRRELTAKELAPELQTQFASPIQLALEAAEGSHGGRSGQAELRLLHLALASIPKEGKIRGDDPALHFARRFASSCARPQLCLMGPSPALDDVSDELLALLGEGKVAVLDVPCGAGAATASLVETLRALRREGVMSRQPLELLCLGADLLPPALELAGSLLGRIQAEELGVRFHCEHMTWDARQANSTARLMDHWLELGRDCHRHLVVVTNFSGSLQHEAEFAAISPALEQIAGRLANREHLFLWVEPRAAPAPNVYRWLGAFVRSRLRFWPSHSSSELFRSFQCRMRHPLKGAVTYPVNLSVQRYGGTTA